MLFRFLTSVRLTIALLLGLSLVSIIGTVKAVEANRFDIFYQALWYRALLGLLAVNVAACTWKTIRRNLADRSRERERLQDSPAADAVVEGPRETLVATLKANGFRLSPVAEGGALASRGRFGRWGSTIVHLSLLVVLLGGILSELGFVGTLTLPVGKSSAQYFSWDHKADRPLDFTIRLDRFEIENYPVDVRFGAYDPQSRNELAMFTSREGETVDLPLPGLSARVVHFEPFDKTLSLDIYRNGQKVGVYKTPSDKLKENPPNFLDPLLILRLTGFRDPEVKHFESRVSILEQGEVVKTGVVAANQPLVHRGVAIYQTAWAQDDFGYWISGFQISKDPGEPLVWAGSVLLMLGLCCAFAIRYRVLAVTGDGDRTRLTPLTGFSDPRGQQLLDRLQLKDDTPGSQT